MIGDQVLLTDDNPPPDKPQQGQVIGCENRLRAVYDIREAGILQRLLIAQEPDVRQFCQRRTRVLGEIGGHQDPNLERSMTRERSDEVKDVGLRPADSRGQRTPVDRHRQATKSHAHHAERSLETSGVVVGNRL